MTRAASIDIGSNSTLLLIVEQGSDGRLSVLTDTKASTRLSAGVDKSGAISPESLARQIAVLDQFDEVIKSQRVERVIACGTQVFRVASNGAALAAMISKQYGWQMEIISGPREAELSYRAAATGLEKIPERRIVLDVGGGSSEVIFGRGNTIERSRSFPIGAVNLTEACGLDTLLNDAKRNRAAESMQAAFDGLERMGRPAYDAKLIAVGGTAATLAAVNLSLKEFVAERVHGAVLTRTWIDGQVSEYGSISSRGRAEDMPFDPDRAEIIVGGALILSYLMRQFSIEKLVVSNRGLRWGLLFDHFAG